MKWILIIISIIALLFVASQVWAQSQVSDIETYPYSVEKEYERFEIRLYEQANFIYATMDASTYEETSGQGFKTLAGYIFGGNQNQQSIAMTSPVEIEMKEQMTMKFMVPAEYDIEKMPKPNSAEVHFMTEKERRMAAITFNGWADDERIETYKETLQELLAKEGIEHTGDFSFLGYDPPFKLVGRKNEVVVELK